MTWTVDLVRELVTDTGTVVVIEGNAQHAERITRRTIGQGWTNVPTTTAGAIGDRADRAFLDDPELLAHDDALARILEPLEPASRIAAACTPSTQDALSRALEGRVHDVRRERFYLGAAFALWGQIP